METRFGLVCSQKRKETHTKRKIPLEDMGDFEEGVILLCIGVLGIVGNIISIPYFGRQINRQNTFYSLLICLSICDLIVVVAGMLLYGFPKVSVNYQDNIYYIIAPYMFPIFEIGSTGSIYFTIAVCMERFFVVCRPFWYYAQSIPPKKYYIPIICFSVIYNIPRFFEVKTIIQYHNKPFNDTFDINLNGSNQEFVEVGENKSNNSQHIKYTVIPTELRKDVNYYGVYSVGCAIIFQFLVPLFVLIIGNFMIIQQLIKNNNEPSSSSNKGKGLNLSLIHI